MVQSGITQNTLKRMVFDAGAVFRDKDEPGEELIGATRGGATFTIVQEIRNPEIDGKRGPIKGIDRAIQHYARLEFELLEMSLNTFLDVMRGTAVSDGTHHTITPDNDVVDGDYYDNIALVADVSDGTTPCIVKILNALFVGEPTITVEDQDEGRLALTVEARYDPAALDTVPYEIQWPTASS